MQKPIPNRRFHIHKTVEAPSIEEALRIENKWHVDYVEEIREPLKVGFEY